MTFSIYQNGQTPYHFIFRDLVDMTSHRDESPDWISSRSQPTISAPIKKKTAYRFLECVLCGNKCDIMKINGGLPICSKKDCIAMCPEVKCRHCNTAEGRFVKIGDYFLCAGGSCITPIYDERDMCIICKSNYLLEFLEVCVKCRTSICTKCIRCMHKANEKRCPVCYGVFD